MICHYYTISIISILSALVIVQNLAATTVHQQSTQLLPPALAIVDQGVNQSAKQDRGNDQSSNETTIETNIVQDTDKFDQDDLDKWTAPYDMRKSFPYYHAGFDRDGRPVWIYEVGLWDFKKVTDAGKNQEKLFARYLDQSNFRMKKSIAERNTTDNPVTDFIMIMDLENFDLLKVAHVPSMTLLLGLLGKFRKIFEDYLYVGLMINTSAPAEGLITMVRPVMGRVMARVESFGTNRARWLPQLRKYVPRDSLPEWYGGSKDFQPIKVYG